jgi:hypothetical protein
MLRVHALSVERPFRLYDALSVRSYVASEALYHLAGGAESGLSVYRCSLPGGGSHWWLVDRREQIVDATADQFQERPPYHEGMKTAFLSKKPSRRASKLIAKVRPQLDQV